VTTPSGRIPPGRGDDDDEWMATFSTLSDHEIDDLLAGRAPDSEATAGLTELVEVLRADARTAGPPPMSASLRRQLAGHGVVTPLPRTRRRALLGGVVGVVLGASAVGAAAAQNVLPDPLQDAAASAADIIGVDLPHADDADAGNDQKPDDPGTQGNGGEGTGQDPGGPDHGPDSTGDGATPADPGTPGDHEPATPATPNGGGNGNANGNADGDGNGNGTGGATPADPGTPGDDDPATPATPPPPPEGGGNPNPNASPTTSIPQQSQGKSTARP
jgi:hypothetical protein